MSKNYLGVWEQGKTSPTAILESATALEALAANVRPLLRRKTLSSLQIGCLKDLKCWVEPTTLYDAAVLHAFIHAVTGITAVYAVGGCDFQLDELWSEIETLKSKPCLTETALWLGHPAWKGLRTGTLTSSDLEDTGCTLIELLAAAPIEKLISDGLLKEIIPESCHCFVSNERSQVSEFENVKDRLT